MPNADGTLTQLELSERLRGPMSTYMGGYFGPSFADQFRNASAGLQTLGSLDNVSDADRRLWESSLRSQQANALMGGATALLNGATQMGMAGQSLNSIADTSQQQGMIDDIARRGLYGYNSYDQWAQDYTEDLQPDLSFNTIRGMNNWQKAGNVLSSGLAGAQAGAQIGGLWGGVAGGLAGLGYGAYNWVTGDQKARNEQLSKQNALASAEAISLHNREAQGEHLRDIDNRQKAIRLNAEGGQLERRMLSAKEFADKVLGRKRTASQYSPNVIRQHCKGGTMVRIKMK